MPVMTATMIDHLYHLPSEEMNKTLCGLPVEEWELIGSNNPVDVKYACQKCHQLALEKGKEYDANLSN